jgi:hypothetical protein
MRSAPHAQALVHGLEHLPKCAVHAVGVVLLPTIKGHSLCHRHVDRVRAREPLLNIRVEHVAAVVLNVAREKCMYVFPQV